MRVQYVFIVQILTMICEGGKHIFIDYSNCTNSEFQ